MPSCESPAAHMEQAGALEHEQQVAAFKELLGLDALPREGKEAALAAQQFSAALLASLRPAPIVSQLVQQYALSRPSHRPRFIDVSTGMRLHYFEWNSGGEDTVLLLHDVGEAAEVWATLAERLRQRGYRVYALDSRGHGESQWSRGGNYSLELMAQDVQAFILEKDLYTRPVAVVGCGLGGAVALALAQQSPHLVGAAVVAEFAVPESLVEAWQAAQAASSDSSKALGHCSGGGGVAAGRGMRQRTEVLKEPLQPAGQLSEAGCSGPACGHGGCGTAPSPKPLYSLEQLPWWGFWLGQGTGLFSVEECAALLAHPLANAGPLALVPLTNAIAAAVVAAAAAAEGAKAASTGELDNEAAGGAPCTDEEQQRPEGGQATPGDSCGAAAGAQPQPQVVAEAAAAAMLQVLEGLQRPLEGAVRSAFAALRVPDSSGGALDCGSGGSEGQGLALRMDPAFLLTFDASALLARMSELRCHLFVLHGERSSWVAPRDAARLAALAARSARSARAAAVPGGGRRLATDHEAELLAAVVAFLEGPAISGFEPGSSGARRPELLDLKPLPQFDSLEQAQKALGPRAIPTAAAVEAELARLRVEAAGGGSDDEQEGCPGSRQTALAKDPPDYFGFVG